MPVERLVNGYMQDGWYLLQEKAKEGKWQSTLGIANGAPSDLLVPFYCNAFFLVKQAFCCSL